MMDIFIVERKEEAKEENQGNHTRITAVTDPARATIGTQKGGVLKYDNKMSEQV